MSERVLRTCEAHDVYGCVLCDIECADEPPPSCNRHEDCSVADELGSQLGVYVSHCHEDACEHCTKGRRHG